MLSTLLIGVALVVLGIAGAVNACVTEDADYMVSVFAGLALAVGCVLLAVGAARRGYHYRPIGAPPGDMDLDKAAPSGPENRPTR